MKLLRITPLLAALLYPGCAPSSAGSASLATEHSLRHARASQAPTELRAGLYLQAAAEAARRETAGDHSKANRDTYNAAAAELSALLRSAKGGQDWNRPLTLPAGGTAYHLRFHPGNGRDLWKPDYFTALVPARDVPEKSIQHRDTQEGIGGALVGVRKKTPREPFAPLVGVTAPVTATLEFRGRDATLALYDPSAQPKARVAGIVQPLAADFSAPLAYYPSVNETLAGLAGAFSIGAHMSETGLYMLQPYDPNRTPLIFVHGLISTARMWRNVINEIEMDPGLRGKFQCWVFNYPTGNPVAYSALRLREELAKEQQLHGFPHGFVIVGHSMGGLVTQMQATTLTRTSWQDPESGPFRSLVKDAPDGSLIHKALVFDANPNVRRVVFICAPHLGSDMAIGGLAHFAMHFISLPGSLASSLDGSLRNSIRKVSGQGNGMPSGLTSFSPKNPTLKVLAKAPIRAPYHSIIGDRGKGDSPNSSDGVVAYWSSHLKGAQSEKIIPGPHGLCEFPQTITELRRILHEHLKTASR